MKILNVYYFIFLFLIVFIQSCNNEPPTKPIPLKPSPSLEDTLYIAGEFQYIDSLKVNNITMWDGKKWHKLGNGLIGDYVECMTVYRNELYVGGFIDSAGGKSVNNIAKWDGENWFPLGEGIDGKVTDLVVYKDELYASGWYRNAGGKRTDNIARWNGSEWLPVGDGFNDEVYALAVYNNNLYAGGWFVKSGTVIPEFTANKIAKWDGTKWYEVIDITNGSGGGGWVDNFFVYDNKLLIMGKFNRINGTPVSRIALWNDTTWQPFGNVHSKRIDNYYYSVNAAEFNGTLCISGNFDAIDSTSVNNYAKWNKNKWVPTDFTTDSPAAVLFATENYLYVGGGFKYVNNDYTGGIFKWDGHKVSKLANGIKGYIGAIEVFQK